MVNWNKLAVNQMQNRDKLLDFINDLIIVII